MVSESVSVPARGALLAGDLVVPASASAVVVFAHGSGSSRHSPRNRYVAGRLRDLGFGTLLMDLLTEREEEVDAATGEHRFDIGLLAGRLVAAVDWLGKHSTTAVLPIGLFGASTGAAAALVAAAERPERVRSVVSRGGRPDLAEEALGRVRAPVLLVVGGQDHEVLRLNGAAAQRLPGPNRIHVVPGAGHLFQEVGALEEAADAAGEWFLRTVHPFYQEERQGPEGRRGGMRFHDRRQAGRELAGQLLEWQDSHGPPAEPLVLALPRGGVPVAAEVARALRAPLDVVVARKIGMPGQPEAGIGAVAGDGPPLFDGRALNALGLSEERLAADVEREREEVRRREELYRSSRPAPRLAGRTVILVDDGLATGVTARAALRYLRRAEPGVLVLAVPVCSAQTAAEMRGEADYLVAVHQPRYFHAVGEWYEDFDQVPDADVVEILQGHHARA